MTNYPIRAEWWREVTDTNEVIPAGCPVRSEYSGSASEHKPRSSRIRGSFSAPHLFIDSRWTPPRRAYKVGDVIEECTDETMPADGVAIVDTVGDVAQVEGTRLGWACGGGVTWGTSMDGRFLPYTVIYVPKAGGDDD